MKRNRNFEILSYDVPEQRQKWRDIYDDFSKIDIFYYPEYVYLFDLKGDGKAQCFVYYNKHGIVIFPFLKRMINDLDIFGDILDNICDIASPYGFSGYLRSNDKIDIDNFYKVFDSYYCKNNNIVSEFVRFHPILENVLYSPSAVKTNKMNETVMIELTLTPDEIWGNLTSVCRNIIRKARKFDIEVIHDEFFENLDKFHELYTKTMQRLGAQEYYFFKIDWFRNLIKFLNGKVALFHAKYQNTIILSCMFLMSDEYIHYFLSGSDRKMAYMAANNLLLYEVALWAKNRDKKIFNLGGGIQPGDSLFRFKASFSSKRSEFYTGNVIHNNELYANLCRKRWGEGGGKQIQEDFFPLYRILKKNKFIRLLSMLLICTPEIFIQLLPLLQDNMV